MSTFVKLIVMTLLGSILLVAIGHVLLEHSSVGGLLQATIGHSHWFMLWRYLFYALIIVAWPTFIAIVGKGKGWPPEIIQYFQQQRLKLFLFFILIELLLIDNIIGHLFTWL